jgi:anti-sigma B factor antagonist
MPNRSGASPFGGIQSRRRRFLNGLSGERASDGAQRVRGPAGSHEQTVTGGGLELFQRADPASAPSMARPFEVRVRPDRASVRVLPVGELDMASAPELQAAVEELSTAGFQWVVLDLRGLWFIDLYGMRLIVSCHALAQRDGFDLTLIAGPPAVQRVFELTGLDSRLPFRPA